MTKTTPLTELTMRELGLKAIGLRNQRDRFSHGSHHADDAVQELARVERELSRRREQRSAEHAAMRAEDEAAVTGPFTLETYEDGRGPADKGERRLPLTFGPYPTGFAGGGWAVRDARGVVVFVSAWRVDCLNYVEQRDGAVA